MLVLDTDPTTQGAAASRGPPSPWPITAIAVCAAISLVGDGGIYVVLPVVFGARGLSPVQVGVILSANRWARLVTNTPAAHALGVHPVRTVFAGALFAGGVSSLLYGASTSFPVLVAARCLWGACWSVIRLTGMLAVTDCVDAGFAEESFIGTMTGTASGITRLGSAVGMAAGGILCDRLGFGPLFYFAGALSIVASPIAAHRAFGDLPLVSRTAAKKRELRPSLKVEASLRWYELSRGQWQLFTLAFAVSCAGNGLIVSTLGAMLAAHSSTDPVTGGKAIEVVAGVLVSTATFNGLLLGTRWGLEGLCAPLIGRLIDKIGWERVAPAVFGLSSLNGAIAFGLLHTAEIRAAGLGGGGLLMPLVMCSVFVFFLLVAIADLCVKSIGVSWRETTLLVQGLDLGAAVGPLLGYSLIEVGLPEASVLAAQSVVHGAAALVAVAAAQDRAAGRL